MKKLQKLIRVVAPMIATLLSAYLTSICPIAFSFIPEDHVYEISLTLYSAIFVATFAGIDAQLTKLIERKTFLKVEFRANRQDFNQAELIHCDFEADTATVYLKIDLIGQPKNFLGKELELILPIQLTAQKIEEYAKYYNIFDEKKRIIVDLEKLFNTKKTKKIEDSIALGFKVIKNDEIVNSYIETVVNGDTKKFELTTNKLYFTK